MGNLGASGAKYAPDILNLLKDQKVDPDIRSSAAEALGNTRKLEVKEVVVVLNNFYKLQKNAFDPNQQDFIYWRFLTYFLGGGTDEVKTLLKWLGISDRNTILTQLTHDEGVKTLKVFETAWEGSDGLDRLRDELAKQIAEVAKKVYWEPQDMSLLQSHYVQPQKSQFHQC